MRYDFSQIDAAPVAEGARYEIGSATVFAVRQENKDIALRIRRLDRPLRAQLERTPFVRGMARLLRCLFGWPDGVFESGELFPQRIVKGSRFEQGFAKLFRVHPASFVAFGSALAAIALLGGLLWAGPWALRRYALADQSLRIANATCCVARVMGALIAAALIPRLRVFSRFCMYRGAINQVLNAHQKLGGEISREAAEAASPYTGRNDAAFALLVLLLGLIAFSVVRTYTLWAQVVSRVLILLAIAGLLNEPVRLLEQLPPGHPLSFLHAPLRALERLFVRRPHGQMLEVALYAFNAALDHAEE